MAGGLVVATGALVVASFLNYRFAYRMADNEVDGWLYGGGAVCAEALKAFCPFMVAAGYRGRDYAVVVVGCVFFLVAAIFSLSSAIGYVGQHRAVKVAAAALSEQSQSEMKADLERVERQLADLGRYRRRPELVRAMEVVLARPASYGRTVGVVSEACTVNRAETRAACLEHAQLALEMERAREGERLEGELARLREERARIPQGETGNVQVRILARLGRMVFAGVSPAEIEAGLALMFGVILELATGFGFYLVTTPWRLPVQGRGRLVGTGGGDVGREVRKVGSVGDFLLACLVRAEDGVLTQGEVFECYRAWCRYCGFAPRDRGTLVSEFDDLIQACGMSFKGSGDRGVYQGGRLVVPKGRAE